MSEPEPKPQTPKGFRPQWIISGGQTGADLAALDVAIHLDIPHMGWVPRGRRNEAGPIPEKYHLRECAGGYQLRTRLNIEASNATLIFARPQHRKSPGSRLTAWVCEAQHVPFLWVDPWDELATEGVREWLAAKRPAHLNVAGSRESKSPGIHHKVWGVLRGALE